MKAKWRDREFEIDRVGTSDGYLYDFSEVELLDNLDYWEKLKHQYAGMAMQAYITRHDDDRFYIDDLAKDAVSFATALIEKLKENSYERH